MHWRVAPIGSLFEVNLLTIGQRTGVDVDEEAARDVKALQMSRGGGGGGVSGDMLPRKLFEFLGLENAISSIFG